MPSSWSFPHSFYLEEWGIHPGEGPGRLEVAGLDVGGEEQWLPDILDSGAGEVSYRLQKQEWKLHIIKTILHLQSIPKLALYVLLIFGCLVSL